MNARRLTLIVWSTLAMIALVASAQFGSFRMDQPFLARDITVSGDTNIPDIIWWKFNEGSGTDMEDFGTLSTGPYWATNNADWVTGESGSGYALDFNGSSDSGGTTNKIIFATNAITVCFWIYADSTATAFIMESTPNAVNTIRGFRILFITNTLRALIGEGDTSHNVSEYINFSTTGAWVHIGVFMSAVAGAGGGMIKFWRNGNPEAGTVVQNTTSETTTNFMTAEMYIGSEAGTSTRLNGRLDDIRIYGGELSNQMITNVMNDPQ